MRAPRLREWRESLGLSQPELSERAVSVATEDTVVGKRLDTEAVRAADGELLLWTIYC